MANIGPNNPFLRDDPPCKDGNAVESAKTPSKLVHLGNPVPQTPTKSHAQPAKAMPETLSTQNASNDATTDDSSNVHMPSDNISASRLLSDVDDRRFKQPETVKCAPTAVHVSTNATQPARGELSGLAQPWNPTTPTATSSATEFIALAAKPAKVSPPAANNTYKPGPATLFGTWPRVAKGFSPPGLSADHIWKAVNTPDPRAAGYPQVSRLLVQAGESTTRGSVNSSSTNPPSLTTASSQTSALMGSGPNHGAISMPSLYENRLSPEECARRMFTRNHDMHAGNTIAVKTGDKSPEATIWRPSFAPGRPIAASVPIGARRHMTVGEIPAIQSINDYTSESRAEQNERTHKDNSAPLAPVDEVRYVWQPSFGFIRSDLPSEASLKARAEKLHACAAVRPFFPRQTSSFDQPYQGAPLRRDTTAGNVANTTGVTDNPPRRPSLARVCADEIDLKRQICVLHDEVMGLRTQLEHLRQQTNIPQTSRIRVNSIASTLPTNSTAQRASTQFANLAPATSRVLPLQPNPATFPHLSLIVVSPDTLDMDRNEVDYSTLRHDICMLFDNIESWAEHYCRGAPLPCYWEHSLHELKIRCQPVCRPLDVDELMTDTGLRRFVGVAAVSLRLSQFFAYSILGGYDGSPADSFELGMVTEELQHARPSQVRLYHTLLVKRADIYRRILGDVNEVEPLLLGTVAIVIGELMRAVRPLIAEEETDFARRDLGKLVRDAIRIGQRMMCSPREWVVQHAQHGDRWDKHYMTQRDFRVELDPVLWMNNGFGIAVRLGVAPSITVKDYSRLALTLTTARRCAVLVTSIPQPASASSCERGQEEEQDQELTPKKEHADSCEAS